MDALTLFGLFAVTAMLVFYALEGRSPWYTLGFAGACLLGSTYGFLQGAWPFGLVEAVWAIVAVNKWRLASKGGTIDLALRHGIGCYQVLSRTIKKKNLHPAVRHLNFRSPSRFFSGLLLQPKK